MAPPLPVPERQRPRRIWPALLRWGICIAAVSWVVTHTDWPRLWRVLAEADWTLAMIGCLVFGPSTVLISLRLKWLLAVHDVRLSLWQAYKVTLAGNFLIQTVPVGTSGGDSVKAYYVARDTPHKHEAVMSVFFDRVIGTVGLLAMSGVVVLLNWGNPAFEKWGRIIGVLVLVLLVGGGVYFSHRLRALLRLDDLVARLPLAEHIRRIDQAVFTFRFRPGRLAACLVLTGILQTISILSVFLVGRALGMATDHPTTDFLVFLAYTPLGYLAGALPIGTMELTFSELFAGAAGLGSTEQAVSLSLVGVRLVQLLWALPGMLVVLKGRSDAALTPPRPSA